MIEGNIASRYFLAETRPHSCSHMATYRRMYNIVAFHVGCWIGVVAAHVVESVAKCGDVMVLPMSHEYITAYWRNVAYGHWDFRRWNLLAIRRAFGEAGRRWNHSSVPYADVSVVTYVARVSCTPPDSRRIGIHAPILTL